MIYLFILLLKNFLIGVYYCLLFAWNLFTFLRFGIIFIGWWYISMRFACIFVICLRNKVILGKTIRIFSLVRGTINSLWFWLLLFFFYSILILMIFLRRWLTFLQNFITHLYRIIFYFFYLVFLFNKDLFIVTSSPFFLYLFL